MSKILLSALLAVFSIFPAACSDISGELPDDMAGKSILTVYFSCTGTTKVIAERIASAAGSDIYAIIPEEPYSEEDLAAAEFSFLPPLRLLTFPYRPGECV